MNQTVSTMIKKINQKPNQEPLRLFDALQTMVTSSDEKESKKD